MRKNGTFNSTFLIFGQRNTERFLTQKMKTKSCEGLSLFLKFSLVPDYNYPRFSIVHRAFLKNKIAY